jgi:hypothetical protein
MDPALDDTVPPQTFISDKPPDPSNSATPSFSFTSNEVGSTFECRLDGSAWTTCTSPIVYGPLAQEPHAVRVRAVDPSANVDPTPASYTWRVDLTDPDTWITGGPIVATTETAASFSFVSTETGSSFRCSLDGSVYSPCTSPAAFSGLAVGRHDFYVYATDQAGNRDGWTPARYSWSVGTTFAAKGPAGRVRPWAPQWTDHEPSLTEAQAQTDARNFGLLVTHPDTYSAYLATMKSVNPRLVLAVYMNGTFTYRTDLPESAYSHDADGARISPLPFPGTYLLDPSSRYVIDLKKADATRLLARSGYDGLLIDCTGLGPLNLSYVNALAVNPATGEVWTPQAWLAAVGNLVDEIKTVVLPRPIYLNSLKDGSSYFASDRPRSSTLTPGILGSMAETWLREAKAGVNVYPSESAWKLNVDMLADAGSRGFSVMQETRVQVTGTTTQKDAWYKFTLASWLLGNDGRSFFHFSYTHADATVPRRWHRLDLGTATGPYAKVGAVYRRAFSRGLVLVNPTSSTTAVSLGATYTTLLGTQVTSVTLAPKTAEILRP